MARSPPRAGPRDRKKIGPIDACGVPFLPPEERRLRDRPAAGRVARRMELHGLVGCVGFMGCMVLWGICRLPPSVPTKNYPCRGRRWHMR